MAIAEPMPIALKSAYENYHEGHHPILTINHYMFTGTLDFVFHNEGMTPVRLLKTPTPAEVEGYTPNAYYPSDHYAIQAYFAATQFQHVETKKERLQKEKSIC